MISRLSSCSHDELDPRILILPVGHLQLTERARMAARERETIGGLTAALESGRRKWSPLVGSEISLVLHQLMKAARGDATNGWELFRMQRPKAADGTAIYFTSFSFDRMKHTVRNLPIGTLHVNTRAATALVRAKIATLGNLIDAATRGLVNPQPAGARTCLEIIEMLDALSQSVKANGECDWEKYAISRRIILLPRQGNREFVAEDYIKEFPVTVRAAVLEGFGECGAALVDKHFLRAPPQRVSSARIGIQLGIKRQRVEYVRHLIVQKLRAALLNADYGGCRFRFRPAFVAPIAILATELCRSRDRAIAYPEWEGILAACWKVSPNSLGPIESGLLELLGFQLVTFREARFRPIILRLGRDAAPFRSAVARAERLLNRDFADGLSKSELFDALGAGPHGDKLRRADVPAIMASLAGVIWRTGSGRYECRLRDLKFVGDRLERALRRLGQPVHFRELAPLIKQVTPELRERRERSVVTVLSADKRFIPVARTGLWALTEWRNVETRTVAELARVFLMHHIRPATEAELFEFISPLRKVAKESIRTELKRNKDFSRVAPRTWDLTIRGGHH